MGPGIISISSLNFCLRMYLYFSESPDRHKWFVIELPLRVTGYVERLAKIFLDPSTRLKWLMARSKNIRYCSPGRWP